jgi:ubiquinone/menaquinone biosynthesis C-methylase UbiE
MATTPLTSVKYDKQYYDEHKASGLDYLVHGYWQKSFATMVTDATLQNTYEKPFFFDAGCACGTMLQGFKETGVFAQVVGIDVSDYMVSIGREHFKFTPDEIRAGSLHQTGLPDNRVTLLVSSQVLEHVPEELAEPMISEFARVLRPGGRAFLFLDAVRHGETKEMYMGDPTHVNIKPVSYWTKLLQSHGLLFDIESYNRFVRSKLGPTEGDPRSFFESYPYWSTWTLIKA